MKKLLLIAMLLLPGWALGATWYVATDGTDPVGSCGGGTSESPWKTWRVPKGLDCIAAGDTIYFKAGTYSSDNTNGIWEQAGSNKFRITFLGTSNTTIARAPGLVLGDVIFTGPIEMVGSYGTLDGIEFSGSEALFSGTGMKVILSNWASNITIRNCYIHGVSGEVNYSSLPATSYDCLKLENGTTSEDRPQYVTVQNNEIAYCSEQAIDSTGSNHITISGNYIHHFWGINVKGGTENLVYSNNKHYYSRYGIIGGDMSCSGAYCGNPDITTMAFVDRFVGKDMEFYNNLFEAVNYQAFSILGWKNTNIYHNTVVPGTPPVGTTGGIYVGDAGFDFYDVLAVAWCAANPGECSSCGDGCYRYTKITPSSVSFKNNLLEVTWQAAYYESASAGGVTASHNLYYRSDTSNIFSQDGTTKNFTEWKSLGYETANSVNSDPLLTNLYPASNSPAVNAGANVGVTTDYRGIPRPIGAGFDIGAIEYFTGVHFSGGVTASGISF